MPRAVDHDGQGDHDHAIAGHESRGHHDQPAKAREREDHARQGKDARITFSFVSPHSRRKAEEAAADGGNLPILFLLDEAFSGRQVITATASMSTTAAMARIHSK